MIQEYKALSIHSLILVINTALKNELWAKTGVLIELGHILTGELEMKSFEL